MTQLLAINTATAACSVALYRDGVVTSRENRQERQAAQHVLALIGELLRESDTALPALDAIAVVTGPGSFTGMRIGVGVAQGLGLSNELPVIPLSALAVIAREASVEYPEPTTWLVAMPARPPEIYLGAYTCRDTVEPLHREWLGQPQALAREVTSLRVATWGAAGPAWLEADELEQAFAVSPVVTRGDCRGSIAAVCRLGAERWRQQAYVPAEMVMPNYIKEEMDYS